MKYFIISMLVLCSLVACSKNKTKQGQQGTMDTTMSMPPSTTTTTPPSTSGMAMPPSTTETAPGTIDTTRGGR